MMLAKRFLQAYSSSASSIVNQSTTGLAPYSNHLTDQFGRKHTYLRISLTERCNLRCVQLTPNEKLLTTQEIVRLARLFAFHGVDKVRLTGGEPTLRKDLVEIVDSIAKIDGIKDVGLTSNGIVLTRKLDALLAAGLTQLNISLDTRDEAKYMVMSRRNGLQKINCVVIRVKKDVPRAFEFAKLSLSSTSMVLQGINDDEISDFVAMTQDQNLDIRFIEYMPFGGNSFAINKMVPYKEMLVKISQRYPQIVRLNDPLNSTSKAYKIEGFKGQFGFITSMSQHFCDTCNRVRITADGNLKVCLHGNAEVSLRDKMRSGIDDDQLTTIISEAISRKKAQHAGVENLMKMTNRPMILIGGSKPASFCSLLYKFILPSYISACSMCSSASAVISNVPKICCSSKNYSTESFSHLDADGTANMVDTSQKVQSTRIAMAEAIVQFQPSTFSKLVESKGQNAKGDIFSVSRIAGICGAKRTSDLIPLCHPLPISHVCIRFKINKELNKLLVYSRVKTFGATGVEMEALTACSVAALTVYDMCKALSRDIVIGPIRLCGKTGGKADFGCVEFDADDNYF